RQSGTFPRGGAGATVAGSRRAHRARGGISCGRINVSHSTAPKTAGRIGTGAGAIGCLALVGTVCVWLVCAIYAAGNSLWEIYLLKSRGQPAVARVTEYTPETQWYAGKHPRSIRVHLHTVEFNGRSAKVRLPQEIPVGTEIPVLFMPEVPEV